MSLAKGLVARQSRALLFPISRTLASSARVAQAEPVEGLQKPPLIKEFKIYRWVCIGRLLAFPRETKQKMVVCVESRRAD